MIILTSVFKKDPWLILAIGVLISFSIISLRSIAPTIFPIYYGYFFLAFLVFILFAKADFTILSAFSVHLFVLSIAFLILPLAVGQVTRGAIRWVPLGALTVQPTEIVRPFILLFFATFLTTGKKINIKKFVYALLLLSFPVFLILLQPSLGVAVLTVIGFIGILFSSGIPKKTIFLVFLGGVLLMPIGWLFLAPYQKARVATFFSPFSDPSGAGYNSIQSMISVGSGGLFGRGLGEGVQTQLDFLPERHTDFIFASIAEELGFVGAALVILALFLLLFRVAKTVESPKNPVARSFVTGIFFALLAQTVIHVGMNMGLFPITGLPLPLVSAGGSSLLATAITLGMVISAKK